MSCAADASSQSAAHDPVTWHPAVFPPTYDLATEPHFFLADFDKVSFANRAQLIHPLFPYAPSDLPFLWVLSFNFFAAPVMFPFSCFLSLVPLLSIL